MTTFVYKYRVPICMSIALHLAVIILVFVKMPAKGLSFPPVAAPQPAVVQATAVNSAEVAKQIQAIQHEQLMRDHVQQQHLKDIQEKAEAAKEAQASAQAHVEKLKVEQEQMKEAEVLRAKQLAEMNSKAKAEKAKMVAAQKAEEKKILAEQQAEAKKIKAAQALAKKQQLAKKSKELQQKLMAQQLAQENKQLTKLQSSENAQAQTQAETASLVNKYTSKILGVIGDNWNVAPGTSSDLKVQYLIHVAPDGKVISATLVSTSGDPLLDDSAKVAIMKSSPLPVPKDSANFEHFREFRLTLTPQHVKEMSDATA